MQLNSLIMAIKPIKRWYLTWTRIEFLELWLFYSLQLIWRWRWTFMSKAVTCLATFLCPLSTLATARQIILHEGCFNEKPRHNKTKALQAFQTWSTSLLFPGNNVLQVHNRQTKVMLWFYWNYSAKSIRSI